MGPPMAPVTNQTAAEGMAPNPTMPWLAATP